jgi:uncharacterized membrane protein
MAIKDRIQLINWHLTHLDNRNYGSRLADAVANFMGSWKFIIIQTVLVVFWMTANVIGWWAHWDVYPFILLNLVFSTQAAYAAPIIMQSQNQQSVRDRHHAEADYQINLLAKQEIELLQQSLARIECDKLDIIINLLKDKA